ncbi:hypothetical protein MSAN_02101500 [Mycena sanguinolenta]|uniref:Uncharacterized protein n=1 Tax=Mycena sanguinolenta TaxID=230812 RepID=A0A8H6XHR3_9AGAR|nr:hypothetical protein MSAN_02101500 [Mycena sanguinolenta]
MDSSRIDFSWSILMHVFSETGVCLLLYGIYLCLFLLSIYTLARRRGTHGRKILMAWSCVIATVATAQMAVAIAQAVESARSFKASLRTQALDPLPLRLETAQFVLGTMNNFIIDSLYVGFLSRVHGQMPDIELVVPLLRDMGMSMDDTRPAGDFLCFLPLLWRL